MLTIAHITVPAHMPASLARACGEMLTTSSSLKGIAPFVSLALMYQSWEAGQPCGLGSLFIRMRNQAFSKRMEKPLQMLSADAVYRNAIVQSDVPQAAALSALNAAKNMAKELDGVNIAALQVDAEALLGKVLSQLVQDENAQGRFLAFSLCEQIEHYAPDLKRANDSLMGIEPEAKTDSAEEALGPAIGHIQVLGPDGRIQGRFASPALAAEFAAQMSLQVGRNTAGSRESRLALSGNEATPEFDTSKPHLEVYDRQAVIARLESTEAPASPLEGNGQQRRLLEQMANAPGLRYMTEAPAEDALAEMYQRFPHFTEVLDVITDRLALAGCGEEGSPIRIPPLLLRGGPGVGKTYFAQELARILGTHFVERDLSVTSEAFVISGMDSSWKGSKPGVVFDALVNGKTANPMILLNEIDKAQSRGTNNSPISPLYALLEPESARRFVDEFVPIEIDTTGIIWICTANDGDIPGPVLSRLEVFDIRQPTYEQCRSIAASVWTHICKRTLPRGHGFPEELPEAVLDATARMSPRVMRKALTATAGVAVRERCRYLLVKHMDGAKKRYAAPAEKTSIGFVPSN